MSAITLAEAQAGATALAAMYDAIAAKRNDPIRMDITCGCAAAVLARGDFHNGKLAIAEAFGADTIASVEAFFAHRPHLWGNHWAHAMVGSVAWAYLDNRTAEARRRAIDNAEDALPLDHEITASALAAHWRAVAERCGDAIGKDDQGGEDAHLSPT